MPFLFLKPFRFSLLSKQNPNILLLHIKPIVKWLVYFTTFIPCYVPIQTPCFRQVKPLAIPWVFLAFTQAISAACNDFSSPFHPVSSHMPFKTQVTASLWKTSLCTVSPSDLDASYTYPYQPTAPLCLSYFSVPFSQTWTSLRAGAHLTHLCSCHLPYYLEQSACSKYVWFATSSN